MTFAEKLRSLKKELDLTQSKLSALTGIRKSSISQYLSGKNEPADARKKEIARALGVQEDSSAALTSCQIAKQFCKPSVGDCTLGGKHDVCRSSPKAFNTMLNAPREQEAAPAH